jgi:hypothetical protein
MCTEPEFEEHCTLHGSCVHPLTCGLLGGSVRGHATA